MGKATKLKNVLLGIVVFPIIAMFLVAFILLLVMQVVIPVGWVGQANYNAVFYTIIGIVGVVALGIGIISLYIQRHKLGEDTLLISRASAPKESEVTLEVSMNSTDPLILSVNMKSLYHENIKFFSGYVQNSRKKNVAKCPQTETIGSAIDGRTGRPLTIMGVCTLPALSERMLTLNFNTKLPSENYTLLLDSDTGKKVRSSIFTIP